MSTIDAPPAAQPPGTAKAPPLARLPVTLFAGVMGLMGLGLASHRAAPVLGAPVAVGSAIVPLVSVLFAVLVVIYATKALRHPQAVRAEWLHPVRIALFPAGRRARLHGVAPCRRDDCAGRLPPARLSSAQE
ncbi:MAG: hypothetical protein ING59_07050 [Burkholderiales bacterium]|nr:hypothetical protein [Burkholderiales bacterium]